MRDGSGRNRGGTEEKPIGARADGVPRLSERRSYSAVPCDTRHAEALFSLMRRVNESHQRGEDRKLIPEDSLLQCVPTTEHCSENASARWSPKPRQAPAAGRAPSRFANNAARTMPRNPIPLHWIRGLVTPDTPGATCEQTANPTGTTWSRPEPVRLERKTKPTAAREIAPVKRPRFP